MVIIHHKEIVKITADLSCRSHGGIHVIFLLAYEVRFHILQHAPLNHSRNIDLRTDTLTLSSNRH